MIRRAIAVLVVVAGLWSVQSFAKGTSHPAGKVRTYYLAAEDVSWDYAPAGHDLISGLPIPLPWRNHTVWSKTRYIEYTDATFTVRKPQPEWLGIMGPVIRAEVGDEIVVHFLNRTKMEHSIHPHGLRYDKDNEGARYVRTGLGGEIPPGGSFTYHWFADAGSGPGPGDPSSVVWWYHSHVEPGQEINAGLLGPIIITAKGKARADGSPVDVDREFVTMFMIFDEMQGKPEGLFHTINGYIYGNLPGLVMKQGEKVRWYLLGMGNEKDLHTPHWHGETVTYRKRHTDVIELLPASMTSADMMADNPGSWMFHCHVSDHMEAGMMAIYTIVAPVTRSCPIQLGAGDFWQTGKPSDLALTNISGKSIRRLTLHGGYFVNTPQNLNPLLFEWLWMDQTAPKETRTVNLAEEKFNGGALGDYSMNKSVIGLIFFPGRIEFSDGSTWTPKQPGECFRAYWREPGYSLPLNALPPFQLDEEEQEDAN
ncbi:MAG TPA: multicopper oxidase domain-containing protein [Verrucomicrobiae bacterium]|nr:multicopper oxidase domain-containing protein [Verrucomicrobiae bacterium]